MADLTPCTLEDGSAPDQVLPCHWDAHDYGNGVGLSFTVNADGTFTYDDVAPDVLVCHDQDSLYVTAASVPEHLSLGDTLGACVEVVPIDPPATPIVVTVTPLIDVTLPDPIPDAESAARMEQQAIASTVVTEVGTVSPDPVPTLAETGGVDGLLVVTASACIVVGALIQWVKHVL